MNRIVLVWVGLVLFAGVLGHAQGTTGTISGTVSDSSGAVLPGAKLTIVNEENGSTRLVTADAVGRYAAPSLSIGNYKVSVSQEGFQTEVRSGIVLTLGRQAVVDFQLQIGSVSQTVEVTGEAPLVDTRQSTVSALVTSEQLSGLPMASRSISNLILLQPGVTKLESAAVATHRGYGTQINISGARSDDNIFLLDGTDMADYQNNAPTGPNNVMYGAGSTREFQVQTSTFSAQYGRSMGGVFNAVSKSGSNAFHGEVFDLLRNNALDARDFFDGAEDPPFRRNQYGGGVGGPIVHDKIFFHASYEGLNSKRTTTGFTTVPGADMRAGIIPVAATGFTAASCTNATYRGTITADGRCQLPVGSLAATILKYWPQGNGTLLGGGTQNYSAPTPLDTRSDYSQGRVDYQISEKDSVFGRFTYMHVEQEDTSVTPGYFTTTPNGSRFATVSHTRILSSTDLNTARVAFNRNALTEDKITPSLPALQFFPDSPWPGNFSVTGISMGFSIGLWPTFYAITNRFEFMDDYVMTRGNHSIQFGGNFQRVQANQAFPNVPNGQYAFTSIQDFLVGNNAGLGQFRGTPPSVTDWIRGFRISYLGAYVQDDWRILPNLTLNLGLRYDFQTVPTEVNGKISNFRPKTLGGDFAATGEFIIGDPLWNNPTPDDFAPRLGFAWTPWEGRSTTVRGGLGLFFGRLDARHNWGNRDGKIAKGFAVGTPLNFPNGLLEIQASGGTVQVFNTLFDISTPHTWQWNLNVQQQLDSSTVLAVGYVGSRGINLASISNFNAPQASFVDGILTAPTTGTRRNPGIEVMDATGTQGDSWYNSMTIDLRRRMSAGLQFQLAYTWSKSINTAEQTSRAQLTSNRRSGYFVDPAFIGASKSLSSWDARNVLKFNYVYEPPFGKGKSMLNDGIASHILGGWQLGGVLTLKDGSPFTWEVQTSTQLAAMSYAFRTPILVPGQPSTGTITGFPNDTCNGVPCPRYIDPASFAMPNNFQLGNLAMNTGITQGVASWDASLAKTFQVNERTGLEFRAEAFNLFNRTHFGIPNRTIFTRTGGVTDTAGAIRSTSVEARQVQLGLKLSF